MRISEEFRRVLFRSIGLDLRGDRRDLFGIGDEGLHPRRGVGIGPRDIDVGVERADIESGVLLREIGIAQEEELPLGDMDQIVALEPRSEEHTSELQSLMRISYAVFCLKKKKKK